MILNQPVGADAPDGLQTTLDRLGLGEFYGVLSANRVGVEELGELTEADLQEIGLTPEQRRKFLRAQIATIGVAPSVQRGAAEVGERRQLTTLFCELVTSTPLEFRLDPEDFHEVIQAFHDICGGVITRGSGYVTQYLGDGLLAHFGYPRANEDDAQSAARAALEIITRVGQMRAPDGEPLSARVGIATGLVAIFGEQTIGEAQLDQSIVGETLNLAARLQAAAGPGQIIISKATRNLCGAMFEYEEKGDVALKGFPTGVTIYRLLREGLGDSRFDARINSGLNPFVGRDRELDALVSRWSAARAGSGRIVHVSGEPGIGKSRLALTLVESLRGESLEVVRWNCAPHLSNRALHPIVRDIEIRAGILRSHSAEARRATIETLVAASPTLFNEDLEFLHHLLGIETEAVPELDAVSRARRIHAVLARWLEGVARQAPVLILMEDAHWADAATLDFLAVLTDRIAGLPLLLLITHRPEFTPPWAGAPHAENVVLHPLDSAAGEQLLAAVVRNALPVQLVEAAKGDKAFEPEIKVDDVVTEMVARRALPPLMAFKILEKAGGVPLFVEELARTVLDSVSGFKDTPDALDRLAIPATLQDSLTARLDQLGEAKELAQIGSVIGREFTVAMVRAVSPDHADIESGLQRLRDSGLAQEFQENSTVGIIFRHALIQDAAYESLLKTRRRHLHETVAKAMLAKDPAFAGVEPEVIALHCSKGGLAEPAVSQWLAAGLHALDRAANLPALTYLRSALEDLEHIAPSLQRSTTELAIQTALAPAAMAIHGWASKDVETACSRAHELAVELNDSTSMFGSAWGLWTHYFLRGEMDLALAAAQSVDAMATASGSISLLVAADHAVGFTLYFRGDLAVALERAKAGAARFDEDVERTIVRMFQFSSTTAMYSFAAPSLWMMGREEEADVALERALSLPEKLAHAPSIAFSLGFNSLLLLHRREWTRVRDYSRRTVALCQEEGFQMWLPLAQVLIGLCDAAEGRFESGFAVAFEALDRFAATGTGVCQSHIHAPIGELLIEAGRAEEAVRRLDEKINSAIRRQERVYLSELYRVRGLAHRDLAALGRAHADISTACDIARSQGAVTLLRRAQESLRAI
jgi:class 3 adenylate cyclase/tetratricopeptide (TPR) repeat protein